MLHLPVSSSEGVGTVLKVCEPPSWFWKYWGSNPEPLVHYVGTLSSKLYPQDGMHSLIKKKELVHDYHYFPIWEFVVKQNTLRPTYVRKMNYCT